MRWCEYECECKALWRIWKCYVLYEMECNEYACKKYEMRWYWNNCECKTLRKYELYGMECNECECKDMKWMVMKQMWMQDIWDGMCCM